MSNEDESTRMLQPGEVMDLPPAGGDGDEATVMMTALPDFDDEHQGGGRARVDDGARTRPERPRVPGPGQVDNNAKTLMLEGAGPSIQEEATMQVNPAHAAGAPPMQPPQMQMPQGGPQQPGPPSWAPPAQQHTGRPGAAVAARPQPAGGGALLVLGGIGAFLLFFAVGASILPNLQGFGREIWPLYVIGFGGLLGWLFTMLGFFGATSRAGALSAVVGGFMALIVLLAVVQVISVLGLVDLGFLQGAGFGITQTALEFIIWILMGIWGFAGLKGGMGITFGIFALLGALMTLLGVLWLFLGIGDINDDLAAIFVLSGIGCRGLAAIFLGIGFFLLKGRPARA